MAAPEKIEISHRTIIFTVAFLVALWFLYQIRDIILEFFVALLIMTILNPTVAKLSKLRIPRIVSILIVYVISFGLVGLTVAALIPTLVTQTSSFVNGLPVYLQNINFFGTYNEQVASQLISQLGTLPSQFAKVTVSVFSNAVAVLTVLIFAFYLLLSRNKLDEQVISLFGEERSKRLERILSILEKRLGGWARGQLGLMFLVWLSTYVGLLLLRIPFALPLSVLAGLLEIIPYIGPLFAAVPAVIIGFGISPVIGVAAIALAILIQQLENYVFVPKVMEKSVGVHPIIVLLALAIGFRLAGIVGIIISIPLVITLQVLSKEYLFSK